MSGKTYELVGKTVRRVGFGAMQLGDVAVREGPPAEVAEGILRDAVAAGVNHLDTAEFYGGGEVNQRIRGALAPYADDLLIATKVGAVEKPDGALTPAQKPAELRAQVEENLRSLGLEALDLVYIRRVDAAPGLVAEGDQIVDLDEQLAELAALRDEGKVRTIGLSNVSAAQVERALPTGIAAVQNWYGLLNRKDEETLDLCAANGIACVPFFPLGSAFTGSPRFEGLRHVRDVPEVQAIAAELGATPSQVGLAWLLAHSPNVLLIPGTADPEHLRENLAVADLELPAAAIARLDALE
jgi:pyridoxine 4-dehydrogenase